MKKRNWINRWNEQGHIDHKFQMYEVILKHLKNPPKSLLDIGCGLALESEFFFKHHNTELYLLEGDFESTHDKLREVKFGSVDNFRFYNTITDLKNSYDQRQMSYNFVDANSINLPKHCKFDLIYSNQSCGYHYPIATYKELIQAHSHKDTSVILDLRKNLKYNDVKIKNILVDSRKFIKAEIEFV